MSLFVTAQGTGPSLVLIHGWGFNHHVWTPFLPYLTGQYRVYRLDLPGYGRSPRGQAGDSVQRLADHVLEVVPDHAIWLGWSLGGLVALAAAIKWPGRIRALMLMATSPRFVQGPDWPNAIPEQVLATFSQELLIDHARTLQRFLALQTRGAHAVTRTLKILRESLGAARPPDADTLRHGLELLRDTDLRSDIGSLDLPTCMVLGERDTLVPITVEASLAGMHLPWTIIRISGAGHVPFLSHPDQVRNALDNCLNATS